ncbi:malate synthase AceB [Halobellus sp. GM3]|uniref:malate synthase AceB n=1 Tax=Halobellus sp. GM3 TaxID=3458410 RepID=UPI00403D8A4D
MNVNRHYTREFVRTFFTSPAAVDGEDDSAKMLRNAAQLRGMQAPDVWVPDNEDATAPPMRTEGVENVIEIVAEYGRDFPGEIHPRVVWHREDATTRYLGFQQILKITTSDSGAIEHVDGFVIPEVGDIDDWKKADECLTIAETEAGIEVGSLSMSVIVESGEAELALTDLREEMGKPSNNLERLFLLVDGQVDYTKDMRAMTPTGELPSWPALRHNTSRSASATGLIAVDGPYDDIRNIDGYHERMEENRAKGIVGIWSLTPGQVVAANKAPLPPTRGSWLLEVNGRQIPLEDEDDRQVYQGDELGLKETGDGRYVLRFSDDKRSLTVEELHETLQDLTSYIPSMNDIVDSTEEFETAKAAGKGAVSMTQSTTLVIDGIKVDLTKDRMWDKATYQAVQTPIFLFQYVYENRPDQHEELAEMYGTDTVERAMAVGN